MVKNFDKKIIVKHICALAVILLLVSVIEIFYFNRHAVIEPRYSHEYMPGAGQDFSFEMSQTDEFITYSMQTDGKYIRKMFLSYRADADFSYTLSLMKYDSAPAEGKEQGEVETASISDTASARFSRAVTIVNGRPDKILLKISREGMENGGMPLISSIVLDNIIQINIYRMIFVFALLLIVYIAVFTRCLQNLERVFFVAAVSMGSMIILFSPSAFVSWDEPIHFSRAYSLSFYSDVEYTHGVNDYRYLQVPYVNTVDEKADVEKLLDQECEIAQIIQKSTNLVSHTQIAYLPQALGMKLGRLIGFPLHMTVWLGRFFNLLTYAIVFSMAVKYARSGKRALLCVGLLPTSIFLASVFSYDAFVTAFLTLGLVLILNEVMDKEHALNWKRVIAGICAVLLGSFSKAVYIPLLLLVLFIPKEKFKDRRQRIFFLAAVFLIFLIMMGTFAFPAAANAVGNIDAGGDVRGGDTSVTRQIMYILGSPAAFFRLLIRMIGGTAGEYLLGVGCRTFFAYSGSVTGNIHYLSILLTIFVIVTGENKEVPDKKVKMIMGTLVLGVTVLIWTALYLSFTPVGAGTINGVQPRYYIPLMYPGMLLFASRKIKCEIDELWYDRIMILANLAVIAGCVYKLMLLQYCS